jgi:DNA-binding MarR family transcriptional regulator/GNAT superfamily N-acetyltransferase
MAATAPSPVDALRQFNRFYTRKIGVLQQGLLDSPYSLTEVRVLYELAHRPGLTATELGADLDLDAGYLSRMLARFGRRHLIERETSKRDGRQHHLQLTARGRRVFTELNARSSAEAAKLLGHLPDPEQNRLADLLHSVKHLLTKPDESQPTIRLRDLRPGDLGWVVQRHGALYAQEYGWNVAFEALVARIVADYVENFDPRRDRCWIAELEGHPVGCIFLVHHSATVAKLRLLLVEPSARGHGVGRQLVDTCIAFARTAGYKKIVLWTNRVLHAARHIYAKTGFTLVRAEKHHSFGHHLVGETWELAL